MSEPQLDWRSLLRDPSLFDGLRGQNAYLDEFVRVHQELDWPKHLDERPALVQRYSWALPTNDALDLVAELRAAGRDGGGRRLLVAPAARAGRGRDRLRP